MIQKDKVLRIAVNLEGNVKDQFLEIQKIIGIRSHTDTFRFLITNFYRELQKELEGK